MNKIYIFGSRGYIGTHLKKQLNNKYDIFLFNNTLIDKTYKKYLRVADSSDICINLTSIIGEDCEKNKNKSKAINIDLNKEISDSKIGRIIFTSTSSLYGTQSEPCSENAKLTPTNFYTESKLIAENILKSSKKYLILRPALCFGGTGNISTNNFINSFIIKTLNKEKIEIFDINSYRPYIPVNMVAKMIEKLIEKKIINEVYNLGYSNMNLRKFDLIKKLNIVGKKNIYQFKPKKKSRSYKLNCTKIEKLLELKKINILEEVLKSFKQIKYDCQK